MKRADLAGVLVLVTVVAAPVLAVHTGTSQEAKKTGCATNLRSLWQSCFNYAAQYGRPNGVMQTETGSDFWLKLKRTPKPLLDRIDPFFCPLAGHDMTVDQTSYRGPASNVNKMEDSDPVGADFDGNHGADQGGNVLSRVGDIKECKIDDALWKAAESKLSGTAPVKKGQDKNAALEKRVADLEKAVNELTELLKQLKERLDKGAK